MNKRKIYAVVTCLSFLVSSCAHHPTTPQVSTYDYEVQTSYGETGIGPEAEISKEVRTPSSSLADTPWTTWSEKGMIGGLRVLSGIRKGLLKNQLHDPHVGYFGYKDVDCSKSYKYFRSADGTCNDLKRPHVGAAGVAFGRNVSPEFIDLNAAEKLMTPNPAVVSKEFFTRDEFKPVPFLNMLAAVWIQFMNHDWLTHGRNSDRNPHKVTGPDGVTHQIERTKEIEAKTNQYNEKFGKISQNDVTHWWDASQIYGSSKQEQMNLRSGQDGKMKTELVNGRELLPKIAGFNVGDNKQNQGIEATGFRDNWWIGLSMLHTLFVKEHNAIADLLKKEHAKKDAASGKWLWVNGKQKRLLNEQELDEVVFQTARLINAAIMAKIHTVEWTPAILPNPTLKKAMYTNWYGLANPQTWSKFIKRIPGLDGTDWFKGTQTGYLVGGVVGDKHNDYGVPFSITEEFTSVYRLHSLLPEQLVFKKLNAKNAAPVNFTETRNQKSYGIMAANDLKDLYYSFGTQLPGQLVLNNFPKFMQEFTVPGHGQMDLGMVDIVRDRERGVPRYNQFRRGIALKPISSYRDFFPPGKPLDLRQQKIIEKFEKVYGKDASGNDNVEDIDLLVGTLSEEVRPKHFGFGETMFQIFILMASRRLMADRFYTDHYRAEVYTSTGMNWIDAEGTFAQVITRHMPELKDKVKGLETAFLPWRK